MDDNLPILLVVLPLVTAPVCLLVGNRYVAHGFALLAAAGALAISLILLTQVQLNGPLQYNIGNWEPPYGIPYVVDAMNAYVMVFVSGLAVLTLLYALPSLSDEVVPSKHYLFFAAFMLLLTGLLGMCATGDLFNLFVFLEISSLASYSLIALGKTRRAPWAALQYLILGSIGATFILIGIGLLYQMTGTLSMAGIAERIETTEGPRTILIALGFLTIGLYIKMAVFPLHTWLPDAYTYAPSVVTVFLAGTATKVSVYAFIRLIFGIITPEFAFEVLPLDWALRFLALVGIFAASLAAVFQTNVKRILAYSSVAQIGYVLLGVSMANEVGLTAGIVHMFNHSIIKGGLFMVAGCFALRLGSSHLDDWRGAARRMPLTALAWTIGGVSLIGFPLTCGFVSKWLLLTAAFQSGLWPVAALMLISSLLAVVYVWRVVEVLYFAEPSEVAASATEPPWRMMIPTCIVILACLVFGVWTEYSVGGAAEAAADLLGAYPR
jgi:multicomponent Na+:H+ antiporter subunit D